MGKKKKIAKTSTVPGLDIYQASDALTYSLGIVTCASLLLANKLPVAATTNLTLSSLGSLIGAYYHDSAMVKKCDLIIQKTNFSYGNITINQQTIGSTYSIINSSTKAFVNFAFTTALTPALTETIRNILPAESVYLAPAIAIASAASVGSTMTYIFNRFETDFFNIPKNDFKVGAAGAAQQRFLERLIFNGVNAMIPWGWGYTASAAAGLSSVLLSSLYKVAGLETEIHKGQSIFTNPVLGFVCNGASHVGKMALESWYSLSR